MTIVVMNAQTLAISEYSEEPVDVFAAGDKLYQVETGSLKMQQEAVGASGTFTSFVRTGRLMPLPGQEYNIPMALATFKGLGQLTLTSSVERLGESETESGSVSGKVMLGQYEIPLSRRKECQSYQFDVELAAGQELRRVDVAINPVRLRKA